MRPETALARGVYFYRDFRVMYYACRADYPCEGCEQPRWMAFKNAWAWARKMAT
jgi:hypothetical protein